MPSGSLRRDWERHIPDCYMSDHVWFLNSINAVLNHEPTEKIWNVPIDNEEAPEAAYDRWVGCNMVNMVSESDHHSEEDESSTSTCIMGLRVHPRLEGDESEDDPEDNPRKGRSCRI